MRGICRANKRNGEHCTLPVNGSDGYCWAHSPEHAEQRRRAASKAGRARPNQLLLDVEEQFQAIADGVLAGTVDVRRGTAAVQALQGRVRAREVGRKIYESESQVWSSVLISSDGGDSLRGCNVPVRSMPRRTQRKVPGHFPQMRLNDL